MPSTRSIPADIPCADKDARITHLNTYIGRQHEEIAWIEDYIDTYAHPDGIQELLDMKDNLIYEQEREIQKLKSNAQIDLNAIEELRNDNKFLERWLMRTERELERNQSELERKKSEMKRYRDEMERNKDELEMNKNELERKMSELERYKCVQERDRNEMQKLTYETRKSGEIRSRTARAHPCTEKETLELCKSGVQRRPNIKVGGTINRTRNHKLVGILADEKWRGK
jgi:chromosome segregation ATPase